MQREQQQANREESKPIDVQILELRIQVGLLAKALIENGQAIACLHSDDTKQSRMCNFSALETIHLYQDFCEGNLSLKEVQDTLEEELGGVE